MKKMHSPQARRNFPSFQTQLSTSSARWTRATLAVLSIAAMPGCSDSETPRNGADSAQSPVSMLQTCTGADCTNNSSGAAGTNMDSTASDVNAGGASNSTNENGELGSLDMNENANGQNSGETDAGVLADAAVEPIPACTPFPNQGSTTDGDANINLSVEFQNISGFGGINLPTWFPGFTEAHADTAFGNGPGQMGMTILRLRVPYDATEFALEVPIAQRAVALGAKVFASPWTPPPALKTNNNIVAGSLRENAYTAYADHLLSFRDFMESNGVPIEAISVQNEPDIAVTYESCDWTPQEMINWLVQEGPRFGDTKLIAAESFNFNRLATDPILNNPAAAAQVAIIGGHIYGNGLSDYPLARNAGKELWMTEHYTDSSNPANQWPLALDVGTEIHNIMAANFNAYVWWTIRRSYGPMTDDGVVSKRGYLMAQYSKFVRPGDIRVEASQPDNNNVRVTAYKNVANQLVVVALNTTNAPQTFDIDVHEGCVESFNQFTTSETKNVNNDGNIAVTDSRVSVTVDAESVTTFVGQ